MMAGRGLRAVDLARSWIGTPYRHQGCLRGAGADCLYAPGVTDSAEIATQVRAVAPRPVNVLLMNPQMRVADLAALGVRRISTGGALANAAWRGFDAAAAALANNAGLA
jgi:2-methylisocitrate lyase-like PEP mutase family enzyme